MKNDNLHHIKSPGFNIPDNYFEGLDDSVFTKLSEDIISKEVNSTGFEVPIDYFETFDHKVLEQVDITKPAKVIPLINWKQLGYISGIAASILLVINLFFGNPEKFTIDDLETASIENYLIQEDVNTNDIVTYLNEDDLLTDNFVDSTISKESIEEYLLQNTNLEDLIID